ncbi:hypothetical protein [Roseiconus lacunae]|uniref:hypothetical protein n=1 Tax=Roseiconus lacunae TaxID=2605694 RepID=UPI001E416DB2|nr:hypothetical protein [Roseiconus lacunae]MCD0463694.1 hypothetical protein [Roseiconus lacunae]
MSESTNSQSVNPFQASADVADDSISVALGEANERLQNGFWFASDWSREGLQSRMSDESRQRYFVWMMLAACLSAVFAIVYWPQLFVVILPAAFAIAVVWIANIGILDDRRFWSRYRGFARPVSGRLTSRSIAVRSDQCAVTALLNESQYKVHTKTGSMRLLLPFATESVRLVSSDFKASLTDAERLHSEVPMQLMKRLLETKNPVMFSGRLVDRDLDDTRRVTKRWTAVALLQFAWVALIFTQFVPLIELNRRNALSLLSYPITWGVVYVVGVALIFACFATLRRSVLGDFQGWITANQVVLSRATYHSCYGYFGEAIDHFHWSEKGLEVRMRDGNLKMIIPNRWISETDRSTIAQWYANHPTRPKQNVFVGPAV